MAGPRPETTGEAVLRAVALQQRPLASTMPPMKTDTPKDPHAVALGRKRWAGVSKSARSKAMRAVNAARSAELRRRVAIAAATARWEKVRQAKEASPQV